MSLFQFKDGEIEADSIVVEEQSLLQSRGPLLSVILLQTVLRCSNYLKCCCKGDVARPFRIQSEKNRWKSWQGNNYMEY